MHIRLASGLVALLVAALTATTAVASPALFEVVLVTEDGTLHAYDPLTLVVAEDGTPSIERQTLATAGDGSGLHPLGESCQDPAAPDHVVVGQGGEVPGWTYASLRGFAVGRLELAAVGRLAPAAVDPTPYGCVFLADGRLVTSIAGDRDLDSGLPSGELLLWWPPFDGDGVSYCKLLTGIGQAGGVGVEADGTIVFSAAKYDRRGNLGGVFHLTGDLPATVDDCAPDDDGVPHATGMGLLPFIVDLESWNPWDVSPSGAGGWLVSNPRTGTIMEYDADGLQVRRAVGNGSTTPFGYLENFTPYGHALDSQGNLWIAHYGLQAESSDGQAYSGIGGQSGSSEFASDAQLHWAELSARSAPDPTGDRNFFAGSGGKVRITREMTRTQGIGVVTLTSAAPSGTPEPQPQPGPDPAPQPAPAAPASAPLPTTGGGLVVLAVLALGAAGGLRRR